jgi:GrpB-like predicted nucleotidyltransferase (UPF0157 family)
VDETVAVVSAREGRAPAQCGADDGPIKIVEYDAAWPARYDAERRRLLELIPELHLFHIGSTAVPGLAGKSVIDMIALVEDLDASAARAVRAAGYAMPECFNQGLEHRRYLCYPSESFRSHHLHLVDQAADLEQCIRFRDLLRADGAMAEQYATLKRLLAAQFQGDRQSYTKAKTGFIEDAATGAAGRRSNGGPPAGDQRS